MIPEVFMMMDSTDFEEHVLLNALEDPLDDSDLMRHQPLSTKTLSSVSTATAATAMMDQEDIDDFFFDDQGVEMVIDEDSKPAARVLEEKPRKKKSSSKTIETSSKKTSTDAPTRVGMPDRFDVLCGQSRICASHPGNVRFQVVLDIFAPRYEAATSKQEKMTMTKEIVANIHEAGGRFMKYKDGQWEEISDVTARDKASHALRTKVASWKRQQKEKKNGPSRRSSTTSRPSHRRGGINKSRRSSDSSVVTCASDIVTTSFDGNDAANANVMDELIKAQRTIFANMTSPKSGQPHPLQR